MHLPPFIGFCPTRGHSALDKEILLEGNKFNITSIEIKQTTLLNIKVINKDNKGHRVLLLGKEDGTDFQLVDEYLIQQNNAAEMSLVISPTAEPIGSKHYKEMMLSCTTCVGSGLNSQVKITSTE